MALLCVLLAASASLEAQSAFRIPYACTEEDVDAFGLTCSPQEPCPIYAELVSVDSLSGRLFVTGNLHTVSGTLYGLVLVSDDGGKTWTEPVKRERWWSFDQIQFADLQHGWINGAVLQPLPKDAFLLVTADAGKTWRMRPLAEETRFGSISQFWFESPTVGELVLDQSQGSTGKYELYGTQTGGESWELKGVTTTAPKLAKTVPRENPTWRLRPDPTSKTIRLEQRMTEGYKAVTSFEIHVSDCKGAPEKPLEQSDKAADKAQ
jgi:hypothetical protein